MRNSDSEHMITTSAEVTQISKENALKIPLIQVEAWW